MVTNQLGNLHSTVVNLIRDAQGSRVIVESFSGFYHKFSLLFFKDEKRKKLLENISDICISHNLGILNVPVLFLPFRSANGSSEILYQP